jgi:hypothetical protein
MFIPSMLAGAATPTYEGEDGQLGAIVGGSRELVGMTGRGRRGPDRYTHPQPELWAAYDEIR